MRIVSIKLKNFRSHEDSSFEFEDGINLLIGNNGAGKSSVLEAIGFALFDAKTRTANKDIVKRGEKSGSVDVVFVGNDGNGYRVERKFGTSSSWKLFVGDEQSHRYSNSEDVLAKLHEITGVTNSDVNMFSDVICAVQNRFTEIFAKTDAKREILFDKMFGVGIYRKIFEELNGKESIEKDYRKESDEIIGSLKTYEESAIDIDAVKQNLLSEKKSLGEGRDALLIIDKDIEKTNSEVKVNSSKITEFEKNNQLVLEKKKQLSTLNSNLEIADKNIKSSIVAKSLVDENFEKFNKFKELRDSIEVLEKSIVHEVDVRKKETIAKENVDSITTNLSSNEKSIIELKGVVKAREEQTVNLNNEELELKERANNIKTELENITKEGLERNAIIDDYSKLLSSFDVKIQEQSDINREIVSLTQSGLDDATDVENLSIIQKKKLELEDKKEELDRIEKELSLKNSRREELLDAKKELATGICPILKENCKNTEGSHSNYFRDRLNILEDELLKLEEIQNFLKDVPKELKSSQKEIISLEHTIKEIAGRVDNISKLEEKIAITKAHLNLSIEKLSLVEPNILVDNDDYSRRVTDLKVERESSREIYRHRDTDLKDIDAKIKINIALLSKNSLEINESNNSIINLNKNSIELVSNRELLEKELSIIEEDIKKIETTREEIKIISKEMKNFEDGHKIYIENSDQASRLTSNIESKDSIKIHISTINNELEILKKAIAIVNIEDLTKDAESLDGFLKERNIDRDNIKDLISKFEKSIENINGEIEKYRKGQEAVKELKNRLKILSRKLELTTLFRNSVKDMGRFVASTIVKDIAIRANEYFEKITGKSDRLEWLVDDANKYTVFLSYRKDDEILQKSFIELSGGEQVAVALSIRTALAKKLAGGDFAIFDEPTINLDSERKISLAESIKSMLGTLDQTIIVTHDDVFREMAQKVIEL